MDFLVFNLSILNFLFGFNCYNISEVVFLTVVFRHGARTPISFYPNDPYQNENYWSIGLGQLTNEGKEQQYQLGKWLKARYAHLFGNEYFYNNIYVQSTDVDRTLMSAECNLAAIYPPSTSQIWNPEIPNWQPIPIHSNNENKDPVLKGTPCERYDYEFGKLYKSNKQILNYLKETESLFGLLREYTGKDMNTFQDVNDIYDDIFIENRYNLSLPSWVTDDVLQQMLKWSKFSFSVDCFTPKLQRLKLGPFFHQLTTLMSNKTKNLLETRKVYMYSAHDSTLANILMGLNQFNYELPPYCATILFELRKVNKDYGVTIYYKNSSDILILLKLKDCDEFCKLDKFIEILADITVPIEQWTSECTFNYLDRFIFSYTLTFILFTVTITLIISFLIINFIKSYSKNENQGYLLLNLPPQI